MIQNLHRVNIDGTSNPNGDWYVYTETCDRCGIIVIDESIQHSRAPNENHLGFCNKCYKHLLDNNISYEEARKMYGKSN